MGGDQEPAFGELADDDDLIEGCGCDVGEDAVPDEALAFVVLSPEGDAAQIEAYRRMAVGGEG